MVDMRLLIGWGCVIIGLLARHPGVVVLGVLVFIFWPRAKKPKGE